MARGRPFKCPCGSSNNVSKGFRRTTTLGIRRLRFCKDCGRKFTPQNQKPVEAKDKNAGWSNPRQVYKKKPMKTTPAQESKAETETSSEDQPCT